MTQPEETQTQTITIDDRVKYLERQLSDLRDDNDELKLIVKDLLGQMVKDLNKLATTTEPTP